MIFSRQKNPYFNICQRARHFDMFLVQLKFFFSNSTYLSKEGTLNVEVEILVQHKIHKIRILRLQEISLTHERNI